MRVTAAGSGAPTGGREGASAQGTNQVYCCEWLTLPLASIVMVVTVLVYVTLQPGGACTGDMNLSSPIAAGQCLAWQSRISDGKRKRLEPVRACQ